MKPYATTLDQGDSYIVTLPDGSIKGTGYTAGNSDNFEACDQRAAEIYNEWLDGLRESDRVLFEALWTIGQHDLARRASKGEWNDYFGLHAMNHHHLVAELKIKWAEAEREAFAGDGPPRGLNEKIEPIAEMIQRLVGTSDFNASKAEAAEWEASEEGQEIKDELGPAMSKVIFGDDK